jgi:cytochrome P450
MGPRDCVGQALARLELQIFLAALFSRFRVSLAPGMGSPEEISSKAASLTTPDGLWLCMEAR